MANNKKGFLYYAINTDRYEDKRIKRLKKDMGCAGICVYDKILCEIYRVEGCFLQWDEDTVFDVADYFGLKESLVLDIVAYCCSVGLFNKELLTNEKVLTSLSIQSRFIEMSKKAKRNSFKIPEKYDILPEECVKLQEESPQDSGSLQQSKAKQSKVNIAAAIGNFEDFPKTVLRAFQGLGEIPDTVAIEQAMLFVNKYQDKLPIHNLNKLIAAWVERLGDSIPKTITVGGEKHQPVKNGNGYVYPTITGRKFNSEKTEIQLSDSSWQELGVMQKKYLDQGCLEPLSIYKGKII